MRFNNLILLIIFLVVVFVSGILGGITMFTMNTFEEVLTEVNFFIPFTEANDTINDFQDILSVVAYPILGLRNFLPSLTYFLVFSLIIGLAITGYVSSKNPIFFIVHILFTLMITYFTFILSNQYELMLQESFINSMMAEFPIYNTLMLYLPYILFFTSLLFGVISFSMLMKPGTQENPYGLNYGGDY